VTAPRSPSRRGDVVRLADIERAASLLEDLEHRGREAFVADPHLQAAAVRYLEVIGEAAGNLSADFRERHPDLPVRKMRGFASFSKHEYWRVEVGPLWESVVQARSLRQALEGLKG
jgi:uncharacterized protein with HEPN domain